MSEDTPLSYIQASEVALENASPQRQTTKLLITPLKSIQSFKVDDVTDADRGNLYLLNHANREDKKRYEMELNGRTLFNSQNEGVLEKNEKALGQFEKSGRGPKDLEILKKSLDLSFDSKFVTAQKAPMGASLDAFVTTHKGKRKAEEPASKPKAKKTKNSLKPSTQKSASSSRMATRGSDDGMDLDDM